MILIEGVTDGVILILGVTLGVADIDLDTDIDGVTLNDGTVEQSTQLRRTPAELI